MAIKIEVTAETATEAKLQVLDLASIIGGSVAVAPEAPAEEKPKRGSRKQPESAAEPTTPKVSDDEAAERLGQIVENELEKAKQEEQDDEPEEQDDEQEEQSAKIADDVLRAAANEKLGAGKRNEVKALVAKYGATSVTGVEQKHRAEFLAKLNAL